MIKAAFPISLATLLAACGGGGQASSSAEPVPLPGEGEKAASAEPASAEPASGDPVSGDPASAEPASGSSVSEEDWEAFMVFSEQMVEVIDANKDDCDQMATALQTILDDNADLLAKVAESRASMSTEDARRFEERYKDRLQAMIPKLMGLQNCAEHDGVRKVLERLE